MAAAAAQLRRGLRFKSRISRKKNRPARLVQARERTFAILFKREDRDETLRLLRWQRGKKKQREGEAERTPERRRNTSVKKRERFNHSPLGKHIYLEILPAEKKSRRVYPCLVAFQPSTVRVEFELSPICFLWNLPHNITNIVYSFPWKLHCLWLIFRDCDVSNRPCLLPP